MLTHHLLLIYSGDVGTTFTYISIILYDFLAEETSSQRPSLIKRLTRSDNKIYQTAALEDPRVCYSNSVNRGKKIEMTKLEFFDHRLTFAQYLDSLPTSCEMPSQYSQ